MLHDCPYCGVSLKRRLIRSVSAPGERKFLPSKAIQVCPECGGKIQNNPHPVEQKLPWILLPLVIAFLFKDALPSPKSAMLLLIGCWIMFGAASIYFEWRYLRNWQRYRRCEEARLAPASESD